MPRSQGALSRLAELMRRVNSSTDTEVILEEIAHGVVDVLGYGVAAIARLEGDTLVMTHVAGPPDVVAQILHRRTPAEQILDEFREADKWGILRFVPAGRMSAARLQAAWIPEFQPTGDPDAWHPEHALYAPLYSAGSELLGNMAVDLPADGRVPDEADRELLEMFAVQAGVALSNARERERLTDRVRLDRMLTTVARAATAQNLSQALGAAVVAVAESLGTVQTVVRTFPSDAQGSQLGVGTPYAFTAEDDVPEIREDLTRLEDLPVLIEIGVDDASSPQLPRSAARMQELMRGMRHAFVPHGFRSTFRDWAAETTSYPNEVVEMALAHTIQNKVESAYRRGDLFDKRRRLMGDWATYCSSAHNVDRNIDLWSKSDT